MGPGMPIRKKKKKSRRKRVPFLVGGGDVGMLFEQGARVGMDDAP